MSSEGPARPLYSEGRVHPLWLLFGYQGHNTCVCLWIRSFLQCTAAPWWREHESCACVDENHLFHSWFGWRKCERKQVNCRRWLEAFSAVLHVLLLRIRSDMWRKKEGCKHRIDSGTGTECRRAWINEVFPTNCQRYCFNSADEIRETSHLWRMPFYVVESPVYSPHVIFANRQCTQWERE